MKGKLDNDDRSYLEFIAERVSKLETTRRQPMKEPPKSKRAAVKLPCDVCDEDLAALPNLQNGWVSWWAKPHETTFSLGPVEHFHVTHAGTLEDPMGKPRCFGRVERLHKAKGLWSYDHHLSAFTGAHAMWRMQSLLWNYDWTRRSKAHERMLDFFRVAEKLPTTAHGDLCAEHSL